MHAEPGRIRDMDRDTPSELAEIVEEYRHVVSEHRKAGAAGSVRRHLRDRLEHLEEQFERLLEHLVPDEEERQEWRASLHHGWPSPPPEIWPAQLLFRGRAETGSVVEIRSGPEDEAEVVIDGALVERLAGEIEGDVIVLDGRAFEEMFAAAPAALHALRDWVADPAGPPPWESARELLEDGLIDRYFGLTPRGRRALRRLPA
jgi:hypothetical protein